MIRSKAAFRAIRETVGYTQAALADELGVQVRSIKRWESRETPQQPPEDAWRILTAALEAQDDVVDYAYEKANEIIGKLCTDEYVAPPAIHLRYWTSGEDYAARSTDARLGVAGDWRMANANARAVAAVLRSHAIEVEFVDGAGDIWLHPDTV